MGGATKTKILSEDYRGNQCYLAFKGSKRTVEPGAIVSGMSGEKFIVSGGDAPWGPGSLGRVVARPKVGASPQETFNPTALGVWWRVVPNKTRQHNTLIRFARLAVELMEVENGKIRNKSRVVYARL